MKQRLISGLIGLMILAVSLFIFNNIAYNIAVCIVSLIGVHELLIAMKVTKNAPLTLVSMVMALIPFAKSFRLNAEAMAFIEDKALLAYFVLAAVMFLILLKYHDTLPFTTITAAFGVSVIIPFAMSTLVLIRDAIDPERGLYLSLLMFTAAWGSDTGAYFIGRFFGKRKLAPTISPNKTVEGAVGGVVSCIVFVAAITAVFSFFMHMNNETLSIHPLGLLCFSVVGSLAGILGDLAASTIKRQCNIKDFGYIMPGHGGVLDRFDSVLFVSPLMFVLLKIMSF